MKFQEIINNIDKKIYHPVYFLHGEEPYYIDMISEKIEESVLNDAEKEFNQHILYGREVDIPTIISYAKRYPMMANYQVVIVKEAQVMQDIENLEPYVQSPLDSTVLVICHKYKKLDRRKKIAKLLEKKGVLYESKKIWEDQVPDWITSYAKSRGYMITPKAAFLLSEYLGNDLGKIANEFQKLEINIPAGTRIDDAIVEENIGISKDYNIFELQRALGKRDTAKAYQICKFFAANEKEHPLVVTITLLYSYFSKTLLYHYITDKSINNVASVLGLKPYFVREYQTAARSYSIRQIRGIISELRKYDLRGKGYGNSSTTHGELLKELVYKILN